MINHQRKFIFIHIPKTGGTSIECVFVPSAYKKDIAFKHFTAQDYQKNFHPEFSEYFKFSVVRNPWDLAVSLYHWMWHSTSSTNPFPKKWRSHTYLPLNWTFIEWIKSPNFLHSNPRSLSLDNPNLFTEKYQLDWISNDDDSIIIDHIIRFETLQNDFDIVCNKIGISPPKLSHTNKSHHKPYWEYYDKEAEEIVEKKYYKDIKTFGYTFGNE